MPLPSREATLSLMHEYTASDSLRKHMLAVESAMRAYAEHYGENVARWGVTGLVHDFDYERYPNAAHSPTDEHPAEGVRILRGSDIRKTCSRRFWVMRPTRACPREDAHGEGALRGRRASPD